MDAPPRPSLIILLHGTFAGTAAPPGTPPRWWQDESPFRLALGKACGGMEVVHFCWGDGGANSETVRRLAAQKLLGVLRALEVEQRPYHLVGHSHGGSVIWHALVRSMDGRGRRESLRGLQSWTTIGTPFQDFAPAHVELVGACMAVAISLTWLVVCLAAWGSLLADWHHLPLILRYTIYNEDLSFSSANSVGAIHSADLLRPVLAAFVAFVVVAVLLALLGLLLPFYSPADRAAARARVPTTRIAVAAIVGWAVLSAVLGLSAGRAIDFLALVLATAAAIALAGAAIWLSVRIAWGWWAVRQRQAELHAAKHYGALWRAIYHPDDEAIAALRCALLPAPSIVPRPPAFAAQEPTRLILAPLEVFRLLADQFVWETAMTGLQGDDLTGAHVRTSGLAPRVLATKIATAARVLTPAIAAGANEKGSSLFRELRTWLADAYRTQNVDEAVHHLMHILTFDAIIHNSYFIEDGPLGPDGLKTQIGRTEVIELVSASILGCHPLAPPRSPAAEGSPVVSRRRRHLLLHWTRVLAVDAACVFVFASCYVGYVALVLPLRLETQYVAVLQLLKQPGALATSDSPVVGAFLARLAASTQDAALAESAIYDLSEPNARAVAAQRVAFLAGLRAQQFPWSDKDDAAAQRLTQIARLDAQRGQRVLDLARLSFVSGLVASGKEVSRQQAQDALSLWNRLECFDTDLDAAAAMVAQVAAAAHASDLVSTIAESASARRGGQCEGAPNEGADAWIRAFLTGAAYDVLSWDEVRAESTEIRQHRLETAATLIETTVSGTRVVDALAADAEEAAEACRREAQVAADRLAELNGTPLCRTAATTARSTISHALDRNALSAIDEAPLAPVLSEVSNACRSDPNRRSGHLDEQLQKAFGICRSSLQPARLIVAATAVQLASGREPTHRRLVDNMVARLPQTATTYGDGLLWPILDVYHRERVVNPDPRRDRRVTRSSLDALSGRIALAQQRLAWGCVDKEEVPCAGPPRLDYVWTAVTMLQVIDPGRERNLLLHADEEIQKIRCDPHAQDGQGGDRSILLQLAKANDLANLSQERDRAVDALICGDDHRSCPRVLDYWTPDQMLTLAEVVKTRFELLSMVRKCIDAKIREETSATKRAWFVQRLANSYLLEDDLYGARTAAMQAGATNYVLAGLCPILEARARESERDRSREGNWPQPIPITFKSHPRFSYENDRPQPLQCRGWRTFDLD